ncbi:DUF4139 domain-containing protein [Kitasatospora sp. NBC_01302]|uniref:DUF4139 domain-containing protein n=1 Tax=Kitasatospora sp. NBC_01302 TaxID=2903575 RepID=UPI002E0D7AE7|nr:DUF4139 domain-containing protein [Kitasatospora sp. NBC_01302]
MTDERTDTTAPPAWPTVLDSVVVHASGAVCRRLAHGTLPVQSAPEGSPPAPRRLRLTGLPSSLRPDSLRAALPEGPAGWRITEVRQEAEARLTEPEQLPELRTRLTQAEQAEAALSSRSGRLATRIAQTAELRAVPPPQHPTDPGRPAAPGQGAQPLRRAPAEALLTLADFVDERLTVLHAEAEALGEQLRQATRERELLADRLARASTAEPTTPVGTSAVVLLTLTPDEDARPLPAEPIAVALEYRVPDARWVPTYQLDHRQDGASGTLLLRAAVAQRTGEDWSGVRIAFSSADLHRPAGLPELRSIRIGRRQPAPAPSGWREPPSGLGDLFADYDSVPRPTAPAPRPQPVALGAAPAGPPRPEQLRHRAAGPRSYGAVPSGPPPAAPSAPQSAPTPSGPPPGAGAPRLMHAQLASFDGAPPAPPAPGAPVPPEPQPPHPAPDLLDYAGLTLAGPTAPAGRRGRLHPDARHRTAADHALAPALPPHAVPPRVSAGSFDQRHDAEARTDVPSDGVWHTVGLGRLPVALRPEYVCVPAVDPTVYATLLLANTGDRALLAGPLEVTVDDAFLLTTALPTLAPGATRRIGLGVAESVRVTRRTESQESTAGLRGSTTVLTEQIHLELANRLTRPVTVEVRERIPVTGEKEIRIEERPGTPPWSAPATPLEIHPPGSRLWQVDLPPGGRVALSAGYEIRIPAGKALTGGNRRS